MCIHTLRIVGSGYYFPKKRRDTELLCEKCGDSWTAMIFPDGSGKLVHHKKHE